jgi:hypothetical protein
MAADGQCPDSGAAGEVMPPPPTAEDRAARLAARRHARDVFVEAAFAGELAPLPASAARAAKNKFAAPARRGPAKPVAGRRAAPSPAAEVESESEESEEEESEDEATESTLNDVVSEDIGRVGRHRAPHRRGRGRAASVEEDVDVEESQLEEEEEKEEDSDIEDSEIEIEDSDSEKEGSSGRSSGTQHKENLPPGRAAAKRPAKGRAAATPQSPRLIAGASSRRLPPPQLQLQQKGKGKAGGHRPRVSKELAALLGLPVAHTAAALAPTPKPAPRPSPPVKGAARRR